MTTTTFDFQNFIDTAIKNSPEEANLLRKIIRALKAAGTPIVEIFDGEEFVAVKTERDIFEQVFNLDDSRLYTADGSWVRFIGGEGWDALCDYTLSLEDALKPVNDYIESKW